MPLHQKDHSQTTTVIHQSHALLQVAPLHGFRNPHAKLPPALTVEMLADFCSQG